jgi:hypothetical protein
MQDLEAANAEAFNVDSRDMLERERAAKLELATAEVMVDGQKKKLSRLEIEELIKSQEKESNDLKESLFKICWYMRGGITIEQAYQLDQEDRNIVFKIIEENLETTKKSGLPFF